MKNPIYFSVFFLFGPVCFAGHWTGILVDQACVDRIMNLKQPIGAFRTMNLQCPVNNSTTSFSVILHDGRILKLNRAGSGQAVEAIHNVNPQTWVTVAGTLRGKTIDVQSLNLK